MQHWSEGLRAAQWYGGLEYFLTRVGPDTIGNSDTPPENFQEAYRDLVEQAGGWFTYGPEGREFVPGTYDELVAAASQASGDGGRQRRP
jgi:hypothetical protein